MEGFIEHNDSFWRIQGHVLVVRDRDIDILMDDVATELCLPWAFSDEGDFYQFSHPLSMQERGRYAWLYHRMEALNKELDTDATPPHNPGPTTE